MFDRETLYFVNTSCYDLLLPAWFVFELFSLVLFSSSLNMMVKRQTLIIIRRLQICRILEFHLIPDLLAAALNTYPEFPILKVDCHC
jgi:hypothetical protein